MDGTPGFFGKEEEMDGKCRCSWVNSENPLLVRYHDEEWGKTPENDGKLFEMLLLECFQAGLSWECILNKRENFRAAFDGFDPEKIAAYDEEKCARLLEDAGIVRHRGKIRAAVTNARVFLEIQQEYGSFSDFLWGFTDGETTQDQGGPTSLLSDRISAALRRRGMKFVGSTTVYAFLQAMGMVQGHEKGCFLAREEA